LLVARACAWALLMAGWVGFGALALHLAPSIATGFALVALWLLALGAAAAMPRHWGASRAPLNPAWRALALLAVAGFSGAMLWFTPRGGGIATLVAALLGWAALTALASGVVRLLRVQQAVLPRPPLASAALGAAAAVAAIGDPADLIALSWHLALLACGSAALLAALQVRAAPASAARPGCRAGLFDCSLPAWPTGAWRDPLQWPTLLAGLAMLPMMAELPLMADWCRPAALIGPQAMVLLHLGAMFGPVWLLSRWLARWSLTRLAFVCTALLALGAAALAWAPAPWDWLILAAAQGTAWGLAWGGLLWAPQRRGGAGSSPLRAAAGYALLTVAFGVLVEAAGARGAAVAHGALGVLSIAAIGYAMTRRGFRGGLNRNTRARVKRVLETMRHS
jgi:hypothetical protein